MPACLSHVADRPDFLGWSGDVSMRLAVAVAVFGKVLPSAVTRLPARAREPATSAGSGRPVPLASPSHFSYGPHHV